MRLPCPPGEGVRVRCVVRNLLLRLLLSQRCAARCRGAGQRLIASCATRTVRAARDAGVRTDPRGLAISRPQGGTTISAEAAVRIAVPQVRRSFGVPRAVFEACFAAPPVAAVSGSSRCRDLPELVPPLSGYDRCRPGMAPGRSSAAHPREPKRRSGTSATWASGGGCSSGTPHFASAGHRSRSPRLTTPVMSLGGSRRDRVSTAG